MVLFLLILAYCGKYFCTSCLYVAQDLWMPDQNITPVQASWMFVCGYIASMAGKAVAGPWSDIYGGKIVMGVSAGGFLTWITVFAYVPQISESLGLPQFDMNNYFAEFLGIWILNGFFALGLSWVAIMAIASNWVPASHTGRLMAILGLAPELGDSWARVYLAPTVDETGSWQQVLLAAARFSCLLCIPMFLFVSNSPEEAAAAKSGAKVEKKADAIPFSTRIKKLFRDSPLISLLMTLCGFLYAIRTMFLLYSVNYLGHVLCAAKLGVNGTLSLDVLQDTANEMVSACIRDRLTVSEVANASAWYTVFGCAGVYLSGILKDTLPKRHRSTILVGNVCILACSLSVMKFYPMNEIPMWLATLCVGGVGFSVFGAYKTSTGAFAVDIGGKHMKATCSALMGFSSNGAAALIIVVKGSLGNDWDMMFATLIGCSLCALGCAGAIYSDDLKKIGVPSTNGQTAALLA